jgi:hypothetical protein
MQAHRTSGAAMPGRPSPWDPRDHRCVRRDVFGQVIGWYRAGEGAGLIGAVVGAVIALVIWGLLIAGRRWLASVLAHNIETLQRCRAEEQAAATFEQRLAGAMTRFTGNMRFVGLHLAVFGFWIVAQSRPGSQHSAIRPGPLSSWPWRHRLRPSSSRRPC